MSEHGTRSRYNQGCRCDGCRQANNDYTRRWSRARHGWKAQKYGKTPTHGTIYCYNNGCRRPECRAAHAVRHREWQSRQTPPPPGDPRHGLNGYGNYGCRCPICYAAKSEENRLMHTRLRRRSA